MITHQILVHIIFNTYDDDNNNSNYTLIILITMIYHLSIYDDNIILYISHACNTSIDCCVQVEQFPLVDNPIQGGGDTRPVYTYNIYSTCTAI